MTSILLLVSNEVNDGINRSLRLMPRVETVPVSDILGECRWDFQDGHLDIDLPAALHDFFRRRVIINNTFFLENLSIFAHPSCKSFSPGWGYITLKKLAATSICSAFDYGPRGISRSLMALPNQWYYAARYSSVAIPDYFYGFGGEDFPDWALDWLRKSVWSLFEWREGDKLDRREKNWHRFAVRPVVGKPLIFAFLVDAKCQVTITVLSGEGSDQEVLEKIIGLAQHVSQFTRSLMGEVLVWVNNGDLVFGAYSPFMEMASTHKGFLDDLYSWCRRIPEFHVPIRHECNLRERAL